jgi:hypothetical protein
MGELNVYSKATLYTINEKCSGKIDTPLYNCMLENSVSFVNTRDENAKERVFLGYPDKIFKNYNSPDFDHYLQTCCSEFLVALHGVTAAALFKYEYFIYRVYAFGITRKVRVQLPAKKKSVKTLANS